MIVSLLPYAPLIIGPLLIYLVAMQLDAPIQRDSATSLLFDGITENLAYFGIIGSIISTSFLMVGIVVFSSIYGVTALYGAILALVTVPVGLYFFCGANFTRQKFQRASCELNIAQPSIYHVLFFYSKPSSHRILSFFILFFCATVIFLEVSYLYVFLTLIFPNPLPSANTILWIFLIVTFCYVYLFGFRGALETDKWKIYISLVFIGACVLTFLQMSGLSLSGAGVWFDDLFRAYPTSANSQLVNTDWHSDDHIIYFHGVTAIYLSGLVLYLGNFDIWHKFTYVRVYATSRPSYRFFMLTIGFAVLCTAIILLPALMGIKIFDKYVLGHHPDVREIYNRSLHFNVFNHWIDDTALQIRDSRYFAPVKTFFQSACAMLLAFAAMTTIDAQAVSFAQARAAMFDVQGKITDPSQKIVEWTTADARRDLRNVLVIGFLVAIGFLVWSGQRSPARDFVADLQYNIWIPAFGFLIMSIITLGLVSYVITSRSTRTFSARVFAVSIFGSFGAFTLYNYLSNRGSNIGPWLTQFPDPGQNAFQLLFPFLLIYYIFIFIGHRYEDWYQKRTEEKG